MMCAGMYREVKICIKTISDHLIIAAATDPQDPRANRDLWDLRVNRDLWDPLDPWVNRDLWDLRVNQDLWG